jgi:hypothetical protein
MQLQKNLYLLLNFIILIDQLLWLNTRNFAVINYRFISFCVNEVLTITNMVTA